MLGVPAASCHNFFPGAEEDFSKKILKIQTAFRRSSAGSRSGVREKSRGSLRKITE